MQLENLRIQLRPIEKTDAEAIYAYRSDKLTNQFQGWIPNDISDAIRFIERNPSTFDLPETWFQLVIIDKNLSQVIGDIGVHFFGAENLQVELGVTLNKEFHGKGFAHEALRILITYLFEKLGKHRISASIDPRNLASENMLKKLNFRKEAHFIKSYYQDGAWVDDVVYAMLQEDWLVVKKN